MLAVLRPALAVLLLVGVGVASVDAVHPCCGADLSGCAFLDPDDDDARIGGLAAVVPTPPQLTRAEQPPLTLETTPPRSLSRAAEVLADAPKTSPPA